MSDEPLNRPPTAWEYYRRTIVLTQLFVLGACAGMLYFRAPATIVVAMFFSLQVFGFLGAVVGSRMSRRLAAKADELPLKRRRKL